MGGRDTYHYGKTIYRPDMDHLTCPSSDYASRRDNISRYKKGLCYIANNRPMVRFWGTDAKKLNKIPKFIRFECPEGRLLLRVRAEITSHFERLSRVA